jgi:hypothetical protein
MSDEDPKAEIAETSTTPEQVEPVEEFDKERAMATIKKLREHEKEAAKLAKELDAYKKAETERKQAEMSEIDRLKAQIEEAQAKATRLERESIQRQAAEAAGLPAALAGRIQGDTLEAMTADAKQMLEALPKPNTTKPPQVHTTNPGANATQGETDDQKRRRLGLL